MSSYYTALRKGMEW
nr:unnamed protein product [Callosobruchus chinensis]